MYMHTAVSADVQKETTACVEIHEYIQSCQCNNTKLWTHRIADTELQGQFRLASNEFVKEDKIIELISSNPWIEMLLARSKIEYKQIYEHAYSHVSMCSTATIIFNCHNGNI